MKKLLLLTLILCLVLPCFGCNQGDLPPAGDGTTDGTTTGEGTDGTTEESTTGEKEPDFSAFPTAYDTWGETIEKHTYENLPVGTMQAWAAQIENKSLNELSLYSIDSTRRGHRFTISTSSVTCFTLEHYNLSYPVEYIKMLDEEHLCVVYLTSIPWPKMAGEAHKNDTAHLFVLFQRRVNEYHPGVYTEEWDVNTEFYYEKAENSYADYTGIKVGDTAEALFAIDPAVIFDSCGRTGGFDYFTILSDGILEVQTERPRPQESPEEFDVVKELETFTITRIDFYPYGSKYPHSLVEGGEPPILCALEHPELADFVREVLQAQK